MSMFLRFFSLLKAPAWARRLCLALVCGILISVVLSGCGRESAFDYHLQTGLARLKGGEFEAAIVHLKKAAQRRPTSASAYCNLGIAYWKHGDLERAIEMLTMANDLDGTDSRPIELLAYVHMDAGRYGDARLQLERANNGLPDQPRVLTHMALLEYEAGDATKAKTYLRRALQIDSNYGPALYNMGVYSLIEAKDKSAAQSFFARYVASNRDGSRVNDALEQLEQLRRPPPPVAARPEQVTPPISPPASPAPPAESTPPAESAPPPEKNAPVESAPPPEKPAPAAKPIDVRESEKPARSAESAQAHWKMAMTAHTYKDWPAAVRHYEKAVALDPKLRRVAYNLGIAYKEMGNAEEARKAFESELKLDPSMVKAHYMLAVVLRDLKDTKAAIKAAEDTLKLDGRHGKSHFLLGLLHWEQGDFVASRQYFNSAVQYSPDAASRKRAEAWLKNLDQ